MPEKSMGGSSDEAAVASLNRFITMVLFENGLV
jgi:hypothetical protein